MTLVELFFAPEMAPFAVALGLVVGLLALELVAAIVGGSLMGSGASADGADVDLDADLGAGLGPDLDVDLDADIDADVEMDLDADVGAGGAAADGLAGALSWLGVGHVPLMIWLASALTGFGLVGYTLQTVSAAVAGGLVPALAAVALALPLGLLFAANASRLVARIVPKLETSAVSRRTFGGRVGVISQGVARRGRPAQARFKDRHGEIHFILVEPFDDATEIAQGEEVVLMRAKGGGYRAIPLDQASLRLKSAARRGVAAP